MDHEICRAGRRVEGLPQRLVRISSDAEEAPVLLETSGLASIDYLALSARLFVGTEDTRKDPTLENLSILETTGKSLDTSSFPKAFTDAFTITRRLGFEYIYIAPLCHVSDDPLDLISIFAQATLLLSADNVSSPTDGLIQDRAVFNSPPLGTNKDRYLRLSCLRNHADLGSSPLSTSGWAFIERVLAPRVLHFTKRQLIWECADGWKFEASNVEDTQYGSGMIRGTYQKKLTQPYIKEYLSREAGNVSNPSIQDTTQTSNLNDYAQRLEVWYQLIDTISRTTFPSQLAKSNALSLITKIMDNNTFGTNLSGIFTTNIAYGLAWSRVNALLTPNRDAHAPSWSWESVQGSISHMYTSYPPSILHIRSTHASWIDKHIPHLLSHDSHSSSTHPSSSLPVSHPHPTSPSLECKASLTSILHLCAHFAPHFPKYTIHLVLDQSPIFDCSCCGPRSDARQESGMQELEERKLHYFAMYVVGDLDVEAGEADPWKVGRCADMLVLRMLDARGEMGRAGGDGDGDEGVAAQREKIRGGGGVALYERVGLVRLSFASYEKNAEDEASIQEKFDGVGWDRKTIRLV
ncbi:uncharacterized protein EAF02_007394 [Botrytis sinoallii]|uniref:uncharacterized protein n=1 Tax=Botrytis sinoallii TaxID=1463999 RepID=UPI0019009BE2|nr:uncharacterized protein EAF02_007394 [Botrytis sinoallii]KAF7880548.1 hypothetical protein EAF02_007394 [Botrytis sinoallii]